MCFAVLWFAIFTWGFRAAPAGGGGSSAAPPNPVPPHEPLLALCICNFVIEEVQLAEAAGGRGCRPSESLLPARGEAGHSKLLRAAQTGFEPQLLSAPAGQASAAREALCRKVVIAIPQSHFDCAGM